MTIKCDKKFVKHPICKPSVISYLHHANQLSILETNPATKHPLSNYFLQLYSGLFDQDEIDFYTADGMYPTYPYMTGLWKSGLQFKSDHKVPIEVVISYLASGSYIEAVLDEYYIAAKDAYKKTHFSHQNLIFGFSIEHEVFYAQGFIKNGVFSQYEISFCEFLLGLQDDLGFWITDMDLTLEKDKESRRREFCPELAAKYLTDFIESRNSFEEPSQKKYIYGMKTYQVAINKIDKNESKVIDIRPWHVFYEHKKKILDLCDYLGFRESSINDFNQLSDDFFEIRNHLLSAAILGKTINIKTLEKNIQIATTNEVRLLEMAIGRLMQMGVNS